MAKHWYGIENKHYSQEKAPRLAARGSTAGEQHSTQTGSHSPTLEKVGPEQKSLLLFRSLRQ